MKHMYTILLIFGYGSLRRHAAKHTTHCTKNKSTEDIEDASDGHCGRVGSYSSSG